MKIAGRVMLMIAGLLAITGVGVGADSLTDPPPSGLKEIWALPHAPQQPAEMLLAQTLQGLVNRKTPRLWLQGGSMYRIVEEQLRREGVRFQEAASVWNLLRPFRAEVKGAIVCKLGTPSVNVATSLCGPRNAVAVDESLLSRAQAAGLKVLEDVRGMDEKQAFAMWRSLFTRGLLVEQAADRPSHLRDFAVAHNAFTFYTQDSAFRQEVVKALGPDALVYGWGPDEYRWIADLSRANATGVASDWNINLSALEKLPAGRLKRPASQPLKAEDGVRYIAFVMSDGDNIQWLCGGFVDHAFFYGSPLRGTFPMTWEVSPLLADVAPRALQRIYATATPQDGFIAPGVPGYTYLHLQPDPAALARQSAPSLRKSDLSIVSVINDNGGDLKETGPLLDLPEVTGAIYKDYAPYHRHGGAIWWHRGKPCVSYKFVLWEGIMGPEDLAREVAKMPTAPLTDEGSYALVNVHAWSYGSSGGPMEAVRRAIALLPPNTRVVTADHLLDLLRFRFAAKHPAE